MKKDYSIFIDRRKKLVDIIKQKHSNKKGVVLLFAGFENHHYRFRQDSTLYYYSGLIEPGMVLSMSFEGPTMAYLAQYAEPRNKWASSILYGANKQSIASWGIDDIQHLGAVCRGYSISSTFVSSEYEYLLKVLKDHVEKGYSIYTTYNNLYRGQKLLIESLISVLPELRDHIVDISDIVAGMRRNKSNFEVEEIYKAVDCTMAAHEAVAGVIEPGKHEYEIQASIEFIFTQSGGSAAFPSIVASGENSTVLHYTENNSVMKKNDLVVVDIGAEIDYYCADLTRTYPISGTFTKRQLEVYKMVLDTQDYIAELAKPGIWLRNPDKPKESLHHLAYEFLEKKGYAKYFTHSIGHFLGLDVHDVGDYSQPLKEDDVITIEPGIYIPEERIGIRIEDNYWIVPDGVVCLSNDLPKDPHEIEEMMVMDVSGSEEDDIEYDD